MHPQVACRLPIYLLLDCSGSMAGEPVAAMEMGLRALLADMRNDPQALETVWLSIITFSSSAEQVIPLTEISNFHPPPLVASGTTALGEAFQLLACCIQNEVRTTRPSQKGDWKPLVFLLTDGEPTDDWAELVRTFRERRLATIIACGAGPDVNNATLREIGDQAVRLKDTQPGTLGSFMKWVSASVSTTSHVLGTAGRQSLPPPPGDGSIQIVL